MTSTKESSIFKGASVGFGVSILKVGFLEQTLTQGLGCKEFIGKVTLETPVGERKPEVGKRRRSIKNALLINILP